MQVAQNNAPVTVQANQAARRTNAQCWEQLKSPDAQYAQRAQKAQRDDFHQLRSMLKERKAQRDFFSPVAPDAQNVRERS